ncbi:hypothetical protein C2G38_2218691 [Gigaspora rosea]|uniref:Uncharacterized protein n=1 Tax=Gigaspora rosea TaxID=44941 RepID=A0A397U678_9GLOM|nr:hypothetical protein C2G38_2218691 [Gigaspora rosea]
MVARLTTGSSNPAIAGSSSSATKKAKKAKKAKKNKDKRKTKEIKERAPPLIELSDRVFPTSDVPIAPMTASYEYASVDRLMARFEEMEERIDLRLRAVEDKLFAMLDVSELQSFVEPVEDYLEENNYDFLQGFRNRKSKWDAYYEKNFYNLLLKTMCSKRGTLTTKIKDAIFAVFGDSMLDRIDSNAIPEEVHNWKQSAKTKAAYSKLFLPIVANDPEDTYISRILTKAILLNNGTFVISDNDDSDSSSSSSSSSGSSSSSTTGVPEISNVQSEGAPETTQTPEKRSALKSSEVQQETRTSTKRNSPEIPEKPRKRQKKDKEVQKAAAVTTVKPKK